VCYEKAENLQLNQILGIDAGGTWDYFTSLNAHVTSVLAVPYTGALLFNGKSAYLDSGVLSNPGTPYHVAGSKTIVFKYEAASGSCLTVKNYTIVIVLTPNIVL
jgi:hypothetical protein